jgi:hypothetical protein
MTDRTRLCITVLCWLWHALWFRTKKRADWHLKGQSKPIHGEQRGVNLSCFEALIILVAQAEILHVELAQVACFA